MVKEIKTRNILVEKLHAMKKTQLVHVLETNDLEREGLEEGADPEEEFNMAEAKREDESGGLNNMNTPQEIINVDTG